MRTEIAMSLVHPISLNDDSFEELSYGMIVCANIPTNLVA